jgi:hypothetical protein
MNTSRAIFRIDDATDFAAHELPHETKDHWSNVSRLGTLRAPNVSQSRYRHVTDIMLQRAQTKLTPRVMGIVTTRKLTAASC